MARPRRIDSGLVREAQLLAAQTEDIQELRMAQAVLLPAVAQMTLKAAAKVIGVGRATVARLQSRFRHRKERVDVRPRPWGGRRRALMKLEEEQAFLAAWKPKAEQGQLVVLTPLQVALEEKLGHRVKPSVVYRLLDRHGWRKVAPDTRHPKAQPSVQDEWKKNASGKVGDRADYGGSGRASDSADVSGRSPVRSHGSHPTVLGSGTVAPGGL